MKTLVYLCLLFCALESTAQLTIYPYSNGQLWGLTNANLDVIAPPQFDTIVFFAEKSYSIAAKNNKYGTIGRDGKTRIGFTYDTIAALPDNLGIGSVNGNYILLNLETDKAISPVALDSIVDYCYCKEKLLVVVKEGKWILINGITGKQVGKTYETVRFLSHDFGPRAMVKTGGKFGIIDSKTGAWVVPAKYDEVESSYHHGKDAIKVTANGVTAYFDGNGKPVKEKTSGNSEEEGLVAAPDYRELDQKDLYIYNLGNNNWKLSVETRSPGNTNVLQTFNLQGYTSVEKLVYAGDWNQSRPAIIKAVKNGKAGLIGLTGEVLAPFEYDNIEFVETNEALYYKTTLNNKTGIINTNLVELKKPVLKQVLMKDSRLNPLLVEMPGGQQGYMDYKTGRIYIPGIESASIPARLYGHWLTTDGSNRFVIGIYRNAACYENETWRISAAEEVQGCWQLKLEHGGRTTMVTLQYKDSSTLLLGHGTQQEIKNTCTFNSSYRPEQPAFPQQLFTEGSALLKGLIQWKERPREKDESVQLSYKDMRTGIKEYLFADLDSLDGFSLRIPLHMPTFCSLSIGWGEATTFLIQPGDTLLVALNTTIPAHDPNPDYNKLLQRVCLMGTQAAFNIQYQHYAQNISQFDLNQVKPAETSNSEMSDAVKQQLQYTRYSTLYDSILHCIDLAYPTYIAEQRFIDYIKSEARINCALALLNHRYMEDSCLRKIHDQYLAQETLPALIHDSYYKLAGRYASHLCENHIWRSSFKVNFDKLTERAQKDYSTLLPNNFVEQCKVVQRDWNAINKMEDSAIIRKYFGGNREEAFRFRNFFDKISSELGKEAYDSVAYRLYEKAIPNACLHFAANLRQLQGNSWGDDAFQLPSDDRLAIFRQYSQLPGMPNLQVPSVNKAHALLLTEASLQLKLNNGRIRQIDHEGEWQEALKAYRGKTVVIWTFDHYFEKKSVARDLYELQKIQERYRRQNVVFLKCIQQRQQGDRIRQLLQYIDLFNGHNQLNDVFYINRKMSVGVMMDNAITKCCVLYNTSGQAHQPQFAAETLSGELEMVLAGRGNYYEERPGYFQQAVTKQQWEKYDGTNKKWTLYDSTGHYYLYTTREPERPVYELNYDSVFHQLSFLQDSVYMENELVFHEQPAGYSKEITHLSPHRTYRYDHNKKRLLVYEGEEKLYRTYQVAFISDDCLVLELMQ